MHTRHKDCHRCYKMTSPRFMLKHMGCYFDIAVRIVWCTESIMPESDRAGPNTRMFTFYPMYGLKHLVTYFQNSAIIYKIRDV